MLNESQEIASGFAVTPSTGAVLEQMEVPWPKSDVTINMTIILAMNIVMALVVAAVFNNILNPILTSLNATNRMIGFVDGASWAAVPGCVIAPYLSRLFRIKKWYLFWTELASFLPPIILGFGIAFPSVFHISTHGLILFAAIAWILNNFTTGLFQTPTNELWIGTVPGYLMGRLNGYINGASQALNIVAPLL